MLLNHFLVTRNHHQGILVSNINPNMTLEQAIISVSTIQANALSIHLNVIQELAMTEGDRDFRSWSTNIKHIVDNIKVPVLVKQVGLGLSVKTVQKIKKHLGLNTWMSLVAAAHHLSILNLQEVVKTITI